MFIIHFTNKKRLLSIGIYPPTPPTTTPTDTNTNSNITNTIPQHDNNENHHHDNHQRLQLQQNRYHNIHDDNDRHDDNSGEEKEINMEDNPYWGGPNENQHDLRYLLKKIADGTFSTNSTTTVVKKKSRDSSHDENVQQ